MIASTTWMIVSTVALNVSLNYLIVAVIVSTKVIMIAGSGVYVCKHLQLSSKVFFMTDILSVIRN